MLHDVDLAVHPGQVTALVGDNGAGKSTLIKCIAGIYPVDSGRILFEGREVHIASPKDAADLGIEVVYQDLALADNLDIAQNMFLGRERKQGIVLDEASMEQAARETLAQLSVRTVKSVAPAGREPVRRPAADRRHRQGRAVGVEGRHPRRADGRARRRPDPAGPRPGPPSRRDRPRRHPDLAQHDRRVRGRRPDHRPVPRARRRRRQAFRRHPQPGRRAHHHGPFRRSRSRARRPPPKASEVPPMSTETPRPAGTTDETVTDSAHPCRVARTPTSPPTHASRACRRRSTVTSSSCGPVTSARCPRSSGWSS